MDKKEPRTADVAKSKDQHQDEAVENTEQSEEQDLFDLKPVPGTPGEMIPGFLDLKNSPEQGRRDLPSFGSSRKYIAYTVKLPAEQLAALQSIWLELKRLYGSNSPDKSGMIQLAVQDWLKRWDGPENQRLLNELLEIRQDTRKRQYKKN